MRVAVLDDDKVHLELARQTLEGTGHDFHGFPDGKSLLRALRRETFDLLILDWELPDISGIEVMRWARENLEAPVPILFVTNRSAESDVIEGLSAGADDFMVKPIRIGEQTVVLKQKEFDLAVFLFRNIGRLLSRKHLLEAVWGIEAEISSRSLDTHISRLRGKLGLMPENGYRLSAVYSVGYRLEAVSPCAAAMDASFAADTSSAA